jgi:phage terminase large subunit-like protein
LTPATSLGFDVIEFAESICELALYEWQKWLLVHALELMPDNSFRFRTVVVLVARQNGKSTLSQILALWFMYRYGAKMVLGTAQDLDTAEEVWAGAVELVDDIPELKERRQRVVLNNGKKSLELKSGERYKVKAANRRAGRGMSGDLILLDELREHQSWDAWAAITGTTNARPDAQVWALSNAGDATSVVLRHLRKMSHSLLGDPDGLSVDDAQTPVPVDDDGEELDQADESTLGLFEWSARPGRDVWDRDGWAEANPSLGYSITERTLSSACRTDPEWVFRTEALCQWSDGTLTGPFPPGSWEACRDDASRLLDGTPLVIGVDVSWDRGMTHVAVAGRRADGLIHAEVIASRAGTEWAVPWLLARRESIGYVGVVGQGKGAPSLTVVEAAEAAGLPVIEWGGSDLGGAFGGLYDLVKAGDLRVLSQPVLDRAASSAVLKSLGDAQVIDRKKSPMDPAPLIAVCAAVWALPRFKPVTRSRYEAADAALVMI